jgi:hypothetical protein
MQFCYPCRQFIACQCGPITRLLIITVLITELSWIGAHNKSRVASGDTPNRLLNFDPTLMGFEG